MSRRNFPNFPKIQLTFVLGGFIALLFSCAPDASQDSDSETDTGKFGDTDVDLRPCRICWVPLDCPTCPAKTCCGSFGCCYEKEKPNIQQMTDDLNILAASGDREKVVEFFEELGFRPRESDGDLNDRAAPLGCWYLEPNEGDVQGVDMECCDLSQDQWGCWPKPQPDQEG